ncbi:MAG: ATP-binding protein [Spirochaetia bacterium]|nr:ATP-binding protein [Spirochaetia bacterium]
MNERFLPIGIQDFEKLRTGNYLYVDKTPLIYELTRTSTPYFLSRPRRFGKSLLLSTMEAYFLGKKDLFKGLALEKLEKEWTQYPVLKISFGVNSYENNERLKSRLDSIVSENESRYNIEKKSDNPAERFANIIREVSEKYNQKVVILIDEYDKPILDALYTDFEEQNRQELRSFYSPLKDSDKYIRFLFITGITKVSHVNIFSGLNQLDDISMYEDYSDLCGISQEELERYFEPEINALAEKQKVSVEMAKEKLAKMYDGYHFTYEVDGVYNPFSLLKCFKQRSFDSYWFDTATPTMLIKTLEKKPSDLLRYTKPIIIQESAFKNYDPESENVLPVLYQSGYLTIKDYDNDSELYTLGIPNREVEKGLFEIIIPKFTTITTDELGLSIENFRQSFIHADIEKLMNLLKAALADIPTILKKNQCENYYETVTHVIFRQTGFSVVSEFQSIAGHSDIVVTTKDSLFIFELKMDKGRAFEEVAAEALEQIDAGGYADRFAVSGKQMYKVGVVFSSDGKGLCGWKVK